MPARRSAKPVAQPPAEPELFNYLVAARLLHCSPMTVYQWVNHGCRVRGTLVRLACIDVGNRRYFTREQVAAFQEAVTAAKAGRDPFVPPENPDAEQKRFDEDRRRVMAKLGLK